MQGSYSGVIRLRWQRGVLYIVLRGSPLLAEAGLPIGTTLSASDFPGSQAPLLQAPGTTIVVSNRGETCSSACERNNRWCKSADHVFVNNCKALQAFLGPCQSCSASDGQDLPAIIVDDGLVPPRGTCLWSVNPAIPSSCEAAHARTARLCVCRDLSLPPPHYPVISATPAPIPLVLNPRTRLTAELEPYRCGAAFGNWLSAECGREGLWCCSSTMYCAASSENCGSCKKPSADKFCGPGWTIQSPEQ